MRKLTFFSASILLLLAVACSSKGSKSASKNKSAIPTYLILKQTTDKLSVGIDVEIPEQYPKTALIAIASELKGNLPVDLRVRFDFWLKGQVISKQESYAYIFYPSEDRVKKTMTEKDINGLPIKFVQTGLAE